MGYITKTNPHSTLYDRVKKLLTTSDWSDCKFSILGKVFKAHKLILTTSSPVFEAMFYGPLSNSDDVIITDIEPEIFQLLLNYIYTDNIEISSIEEAYELFYASKKYLLEHLSAMCIDYIQSNLTIDNVMTVLNYPEYMQDTKLHTSSLMLFCKHAKYLLSHNKHMISQICMKEILESSQINITEKDLIKNVFEWTSVYCKNNNITDDFGNRRQVLLNNDLLKLLRFSTLTTDEFKDIISDECNLLLPIEAENIKQTIEKSQVECEGDSKLLHRRPLNIHWHLCRRSSLRSVAPIIVDSNNYINYTRIRASKSVFIKSLCIPTRMSPILNCHNTILKVYSENLSVAITCESETDSIIKLTNFKNICEFDYAVDLELSEPYFLKKDLWYKINFVWPPKQTYWFSYAVQCRTRFYKDQRITFEFDDVTSLGSFLIGLKYCL